MLVRYICCQYKDLYVNAKDIPSILIDGIGIGSESQLLDSTFGEATSSKEIDTGIFEKHWNFGSDDDGNGLIAISFNSKVYDLELWLPVR